MLSGGGSEGEASEGHRRHPIAEADVIGEPGRSAKAKEDTTPTSLLVGERAL